MWWTRYLLSSAAAKKLVPLTDSCVTRQLTTKNVRRPHKLKEQMWMDRIKKRRRTRAKMIAAQEEAQRASMNSQQLNGRDVIMAQLADEIFSRGHKHICCATNITFVPDGNPATPEVALAGREKVGKTSLLRSIFRASREVGRSNVKLRRDAMNFFNVGGGVFNIVDLPGFGGTCVPWSTVLQHAVLLRNFVQYRPSLKMLYYCIDVHYKNGLYIQDIDILKFLSREVPNFTIILTKGDQLDTSQSQNVFRLEDIKKELHFHDITHPVLVTSAYHMGGIDALRFDMVMNCMHALPTERLTLTEAKRLSERLLTQRELSTVRQLSLPPTELEDELRSWDEELKRERATRNDEQVSLLEQKESGGSGFVQGRLAEKEVNAALSNDNTDHCSNKSKENKNDGDASGTDGDSDSGCGDSSCACVSAPVMVVPNFCSSSGAVLSTDHELAFNSLQKKVSNKDLMKYVQQTSPWRNPLLWPSNVVPTKHPKANIMRCPDDPHNPYLTQAHFVCPRADMLFRRPNVGVRKAPNKGRYEADRPLAFLLKPYTVPYFPDIVDVNMHPLPWTFLGSREAYYERDGGRQLGVRMTQYALAGEVRPLADNPAPTQVELTKELRALEQTRYGSPIAMLRPPEKAQKELSSPVVAELGTEEREDVVE